MTILILTKAPGIRGRQTQAVPFTLDGTPTTLRALIRACVMTCVRDYDDRRRNAPAVPSPMTDRDMAALRETGKAAFGVLSEDGRPVDAEKAVETAVQAVADGIVRVFRDGETLEDLDAPLSVRENDTFVFIRLAMLAGRMW